MMFSIAQIAAFLNCWLVVVVVTVVVVTSLRQSLLVHCHVSLTYPPARNYRIDFISSSSAGASASASASASPSSSCGMPKGDIKTSFLSGSRLNVTWNLAYAHKGGFRLQLLDDLERPLLDLTPIQAGNEFVHDNDITLQSFDVKLPANYTCYNCTIRLVREAREWGSEYRFKSCADIDILPRKEFRENCNNHGRYLIGRCICDRLYYGDKCQYRDECIVDSDCGLFGKCEDLMTRTAPKKQCYCQIGWFGSGCGRKSAVKKTDIDLSKYRMRQLAVDFRLYWRILDEKREIEMIVVANGSSYLAIGWRPKSLTKCPLRYGDDGEEEREEKGAGNRTKRDAGRRLKSSISYQVSALHPSLQNYNQQFFETKISMENNADDFGSGAVKRTIPEIFHAMDCTDIVIGSIRNKTYRISDYFTRDQSTPQFDSFWGGKNDLTTALAYVGIANDTNEQVLLFRKKLIAEEPTDHSIVNETMHVIWARGQERGQYRHMPDVDIDDEQAKAFYVLDELKYHGFGDGQRGSTEINFYANEMKVGMGMGTGTGTINVSGEVGNGTTVEQMAGANSESFGDDEFDMCTGQFKYPPQCDATANTSCEYVANWEYLYRGDAIKFTIRSIYLDKWTGIGFSKDERMSQTDAIIGWYDSRTNQPFLMDTWILGYQRPVLDDSQDISNVTAKRNDDHIIFSFVRKRISEDVKDFSFTDTQCLYMMYPVKGGTYDLVNKKIRKHEDTPKISLNKVCIRPCKSFDDYENQLLNEEKQLIKYPLSVKIIELGEHFQVPKTGSIEFQDLSATISDNFRNAFAARIDGVHEVSVTDLGWDRESDSVLVRLDLVVRNETRTNETELVELVRGVISSGRVNSLKLDRDYFVYDGPIKGYGNEIDVDETVSQANLINHFQLYILVGCVSALIVLTIVQASCTVYQNKYKKRQTYKQHLHGQPWRSAPTSATAAGPAHATNTYGRENERRYRNSTGVSTINAPNKSTYYLGESKTLQRAHFSGPNSMAYDHRGVLSLPRHVAGKHMATVGSVASTATLNAVGGGRSKPHSGHDDYRTAGGGGGGGGGGVNSSSRLRPDFYFMPSQRRFQVHPEAI